MITRGNICYFCIKIYVVTPHLNRLNGLGEGSQHMVSMRNKKNYHQTELFFSNFNFLYRVS